MNWKKLWQTLRHWWSHDFEKWSDPIETKMVDLFKRESISLKQTRTCKLCNYTEMRTIV